ncbi:GntR family transcriptional regulator [Saccharopolyspora phatthalungensis]|uniref:DNA-binding GntR family transcriptional regulator n=1 Tax=Saccharopolyspora phatthalungensis TaxID=664693 RepID=A0A840QI20_9PSEU|nr:GntR family transcriptional regulator [Saccharopolyspora phatthalungensis]MBB5156973.1 DNA-binding GntR family transcriptional regulator [Saccharopolyspora phatthalungensis]
MSEDKETGAASPPRRGRKPAPAPEVIAPLAIENRRESSLRVHGYLRDLILSGALRPGTILAQKSVAEALGTSRTPVREAMRMLTEEGLLDGQLNHQSRVRGFDASDLDGVFASRIMLEVLAIRVTARHLDRADADSMDDAVRRMSAARDRPQWHIAHRDFHNQVVRSAAPPVRESLRNLGDRCDQYVELLRSTSDRVALDDARSREHQQLAACVREGRYTDLEVGTALHRARTATMLLAEVAPEFEPISVRAALNVVAADAAAPLPALWSR